MTDIEKLKESIVNWIRMFYSDKPTYSHAIIGISGGKDSSICAALLAEALGPGRVIGVLIPNGEQSDIKDSEELCEHLQIRSLRVNIGKAYKALTDAIIKDNQIVANTDRYTTNTPARLRMVTLYGVAGLLDGFVVNTCNLSESIVGWETYGGDGFGDFSPLGKLTVSEVIELGDFLGLPKHLVHKAPSDGMCGVTDEDKLGFTYNELDKTIREGIKGSNFDKILDLNNRSHFKHENIHLPTFDPGFRIYQKFNW